MKCFYALISFEKFHSWNAQEISEEDLVLQGLLADGARPHVWSRKQCRLKMPQTLCNESLTNLCVCVCSVCCILMQKEYYKTVWISTCVEIAVVSTAQHMEREHQLEWAVSGTCQKTIRESLATKKNLSQAVQKPLESSTGSSRGSSTEGLFAYHHLFTSSLHQSIQQQVGSHASLDHPQFRIPSHILSEGTTSGRYTGAHGFTGHGQW